jgi:DNA-binding Lrp family transcriptional regulator
MQACTPRSLYHMHVMAMADSMSANSSSSVPSRRKYRHSDYDDRQIDALMRYFRFENYAELKWFLRKSQMTHALIFVNCSVNSQETIRDQTKEIKGVLEVYMTTGIYDLILKVQAENEAKLREDVVRKIRALGGVKSSTTMIMFRPGGSAV